MTRRQIQAYAATVARRFKPQRIILFGSYAYGQPTPDSNVDLLVIMRHNPRNVENAIEILPSESPSAARNLNGRKKAQDPQKGIAPTGASLRKVLRLLRLLAAIPSLGCGSAALCLCVRIT